MKSLRRQILALAVAAAVFAPISHATVIGGAVTGGSAGTAGGTFVNLTPPLGNPFGPANSVGQDTFQSPNLYAFNEDQNVFIIGSALVVDIIWSGGSGSIAVGTEVASHYVFFDPSVTQDQTGYVDFDSKILAVLTSTGTLAASDYLANTGVNYLNPTMRGLEPGDFATIDTTYNYRLNVDWLALSPGDYVRVLTVHSPAAAPDGASTAGCLLLAFLGLTCFRRRAKA